MYQPVHHREERLDVLHALIRAHPLGLMVSNGPDGPIANPVPFLIDAEGSPMGTLRAHVARANAQWQSIAAAPDQPVLVVFQGVDSYVTPSWYETKRQTGKAVPTWNYAIVQTRGRARVIEDGEWLRRQVSALTGTHEAGEAEPWSVADAPENFIEMQLRAIVGIEIEIAEIAGKWKVSQNRPEADRTGVAEGLEKRGGDHNAAMAGLVRTFGGLSKR